jgi:hypothetical protein
MSLLGQCPRLVSTALILLPLCVAQAQQHSGIRGRIIDRSEAPIGNSFVLVHNRQAGDRSLLTDKTGIYDIELPPGIYDVFISAEGFSPACKKIEVKHKRAKFDVVLEVNTLGMEVD